MRKNYIKDTITLVYNYFWPIAKRLKEPLKSIKEDVLFVDWNVTFEEYLVGIVFFTTILFLTVLFGSLITMLILYEYMDAFLFLLSLAYALIIGLIAFVYFVYLPKLAKTDYIKEVEDNLPLFLLYFYGLISSGVNLVKAIEISAKRKEFGKLSKDIKFLHYLMNNLGYDTISALLTLARKTPSQRFKEFLYELISVIRSGGEVKEVVREIAHEALVDYELKLKSFMERSNFMLTVYTFIFIAFPLTLLILAFLFSIATGNKNIVSSLIPFFLGFIPMAYVMYLYILYIIQPSL
jgi:flagellar protein FlaJ